MWNNIDIGTFWWSYAENWHVFPEKIDCWSCVVDRRVVLQCSYSCYSNHAGGSRIIPNFLCTTNRQYLHDLLCVKLSITGLFLVKLSQKNCRDPALWNVVYICHTFLLPGVGWKWLSLICWNLASTSVPWSTIASEKIGTVFFCVA